MMREARRARPKLTLTMAVMAALLVVAESSGLVVRAGESASVGTDETVEDDLYVTGDEVHIEGIVLGDLVFSGRQLTVSGRVSGDLIAAGQTVVVAGEVGDDVRMAGMALKLGPGAAIGDDLVAAGFSFEAEPSSRIAGSAVIAGYQALLAGEIGEDLSASLVGLQLDGVVERDVEATVESEAGPAWWTRFMGSPVPMPTVAAGLGLGDGARVGGALAYTSKAPARMADDGRVAGAIEHLQPEEKPPPPPSLAARGRSILRRIAALLVIGALLLWLAPGRLDAVSATLRERPAVSALSGLAVVVLTPVVLLALVAAGGTLAMLFGVLSLGWLVAATILLVIVLVLVLGVGLWLLVTFVAPLVVAWTGGRWSLERTLPGKRARLLALVIGLAALGILLAVPMLGRLVGWLVALMGLGAVGVQSARRLRERGRKAAAPPASG